MLIRLILAVEEKELERYFRRRLSISDVRVESFPKSPDVWQKVVQSCGDIILISESLIPRPAESGISFLSGLPENPITIVLHDRDSSEGFAQMTAAGADVVLFKGLSKKSLAEAIETTLESRKQLIKKDQFDRRGTGNPKISDFFSESEGMRIFMDEVQRVIPGDTPMLIMGETGVGKEHLAKAIHAEGSRATGPFIAVNTAAVPEQLLESELFGHEQGAFTGAIRYRRGAFELAHGGTIFLDEIGEMPLHLQAKLLRVLQDYEFRPVGGEKSLWADVRVVAATCRDLEEEVNAGNFRRDLYYRLSVLTLTIPPLRLRKEDIPHMARRFVNFYRHKIRGDITRISESAMAALQSYDWPGNVRELINVIERAVLLCKNDEISSVDLPQAFHGSASSADQHLLGGPFSPSDWIKKSLPEVQREVQDEVDRLYLEMALEKARGRVGEAAQIAGIHPRGLFNKMKRLGLHKEDFKKGVNAQGGGG